MLVGENGRNAGGRPGRQEGMQSSTSIQTGISCSPSRSTAVLPAAKEAAVAVRAAVLPAEGSATTAALQAVIAWVSTYAFRHGSYTWEEFSNSKDFETPGLEVAAAAGLATAYAAVEAPAAAMQLRLQRQAAAATAEAFCLYLLGLLHLSHLGALSVFFFSEIQYNYALKNLSFSHISIFSEINLLVKCAQ
jgi:hypothetical protein